VTNLQVSGMNCNNCARHVTEAIQSVSGVRSATVILDAGRATVRWNSGAEPNVSAIIEAVQKAGYTAKEIPADASAGGEARHATWQINLWLGVAVTVALMIGEWGFGIGPEPWFQWLSFALAGAVQIFAGGKFYRGAWNQLKIGGSNMDTLVALGSTTAFGYSAWALLS
jgi:Cu+-exporting ATPase